MLLINPCIFMGQLSCYHQILFLWLCYRQCVKEKFLGNCWVKESKELSVLAGCAGLEFMEAFWETEHGGHVKSDRHGIDHPTDTGLPGYYKDSEIANVIYDCISEIFI